MRYSSVIDAARFIAALCVVLHHGVAIPWSAAALGVSWLPVALGSIWFGRTAVIVFFVVSGFCVHGPNIGREPIDTRVFWSRRYIRILVPLAVILPIGVALKVNYSPYDGWVTWSLICELVYYTAYPTLRTMAIRVGWVRLIAGGYIIGYASILAWAVTPESIVTWTARDILSNLPVWMFGCWLAEVANENFRYISGSSVWLLRPLVFLASFSLGFAHYIGIADLYWTMPTFGALAAFWLLSEIKRDAPFPFLARGGDWSYSLYLVHPAVLFGIAPPLLHGLPVRVAQAGALVAAVVVSYIFSIVVEKPSHRFARSVSAAIKSVSIR